MNNNSDMSTYADFIPPVRVDVFVHFSFQEFDSEQLTYQNNFGNLGKESIHHGGRCNFSKLPLESSVGRTGGYERRPISIIYAALTKQGMTAWKCEAAYFANGCRMRIRNAHTNSFTNTPARREQKKRKIREFNPMKTTGINV